MRVTESTTQLYFFASLNLPNTANVKVINETTKSVVYEKPNRTITATSFYFSISDNAGFNFTDKENYILEIEVDNAIKYRATLYCINDLPKVYNENKQIKTTQEYITI